MRLEPVDELRRFWALGYLTAAEAALLAVGGSDTEDARFHGIDYAEATSGPYTVADLPALARYRLSIERFLTDQQLDPSRPFSTELFAQWLAARPDCAGHEVALDAGITLKPRRRRRAAPPPTEQTAAGATPAVADEPPPTGPREPQRRLIPITRWQDLYDWPSEAALRSYVFNAHRNGFDKVVHRVGRRVLIDEDAFHLWARRRGRTSAR